jgi:membrane protein
MTPTPRAGASALRSRPMRTWLSRLYEDAAAGRLGPAHHPIFKVLVDAVHVIIVLVREMIRDRLHVRAAMLSYWTSVAIVPILMLGFALTGPLGLKESTRNAVRHLLYDTILASSVEEVGAVLDRVLDAASLGTLGVIGVAGIMLIGSQLFFNAELAYNDIFRARVRRSWVLRFTLFYAAITLGPLLLAVGFVMTAKMGTVAQLPTVTHLLPVLLSASLFVGALRLLPCVDVSWRAALSGGLVSAFLFEAAKGGFGLYLDVFGTRNNLAVVYGSVAFIPVFLVWTYVVWLVVLFGVEVAFLVQHHGSLLDAQRRLAIDPHARRRHPDAFFALGVMAVVAEHWLEGHGPASPDEISMATGAAPRHVQSVLDLLEESDLLVETEGKRYMPARPPHDLPASEVLAAWRERAAPEVHGPASGVVQMALSAVDHAVAGRLDTISGVRATSGPNSKGNRKGKGA